MRNTEPPAGYVAFSVGAARVVCAEQFADSLRTALASKTLYEYASRHPAARALAGRGTVFAVPLPGDEETVVVRHNRHGGILARITGDLFRAPTRAPLELRVSEKLHSLEVPTPRVICYVTYVAFAGLERADVATQEIAHSEDLSVALMSGDVGIRNRALKAAATLVGLLGKVGARHHDLNVKNILLSAEREGEPTALVLDVDRLEFLTDAREATEANLARLLRSARKWQAVHHAPVTDTELDVFAASARNRATAHLAKPS